MPQRRSCAPSPLLILAAVLALILPIFPRPALAQCELRWRLMSDATSLPNLAQWSLASDPVRGDLYAVERTSGFGHLNGRTWRSDSNGWLNVGLLTDVQWPSRSVAFDSDRARLVTVQPGPPEDPGVDVWEWSGSVWSAIATVPGGPTPPNRTGGTLVFDASRGAVLLFGGRTTQGTTLNDLWAWNGQAWSLLDPGGEDRPAPSTDAALAFDPRRSVVVLLSGGSSPTRGNGMAHAGAAGRSPVHTLMARTE